MRLGGNVNTTSEGYVEVLVNGLWGGLCDDGFDIFDANVICKMLNFSTAIVAFANSAAADLYGVAPSGSNFTVYDLNCRGTESSVFHCPPTGESTEYCEASQIAGVKCAKGKLWSITTVLVPIKVTLD